MHRSLLSPVAQALSLAAPDPQGVRVASCGALTFEVGGDLMPHIRDLTLAEYLGYERPRKIRELVQRYQESGDLGSVHVRPTVGRTSMPRGGVRETDVDEYWLTEPQALFVVAKAETPRANELLRHIIAVYVALRHALVAPSPPALPPIPLPPFARVSPPPRHLVWMPKDGGALWLEAMRAVCEGSLRSHVAAFPGVPLQELVRTLRVWLSQEAPKSAKPTAEAVRALAADAGLETIGLAFETDQRVLRQGILPG